MKSEDVDQIKEPFRLSPFATVVVLAGCVVGLWLASLIIRFPEVTLAYMKSSGWLLAPIIAAGAAVLLSRKKRAG